MMAGADRVEGTLFGNGERTGNLDLVTVALNLYTQGIHPEVDFSDIHSIIETVTECTDLPIHPRHPYAGELVFTAFSGSHQDAIKKGFERHNKTKAQFWEIPYLPIDPVDIGCTYEAVIRVNSQSGKGGIAYLVKESLHLEMPRRLQVPFYQVIQAISDKTGKEITAEDITAAFRSTYYLGSQYAGRLILRSYTITEIDRAEIDSGQVKDAADTDSEDTSLRRRFDGQVSVDGVTRWMRGEGNGPLSALLNALEAYLDLRLAVREYAEHAIGEGSGSKAASYVELVPPRVSLKDKTSYGGVWGVSIDPDIVTSGLRAIISAANSVVADGRRLPTLGLMIGVSSPSSQSDVTSVVVNTLGLELPRRMQTHFYDVVQNEAKKSGKDRISAEAICELFHRVYPNELSSSTTSASATSAFTLISQKYASLGEGRRRFEGVVSLKGQQVAVTGEGNGPLSSLLAAIQPLLPYSASIREFAEHSIGQGSEVRAASFVELVGVSDGTKPSAWGVGIDESIMSSGWKAVLAAATSITAFKN
jgi:2-isopropylmalate synthase